MIDRLILKASGVNDSGRCPSHPVTSQVRVIKSGQVPYFRCPECEGGRPLDPVEFLSRHSGLTEAEASSSLRSMCGDMMGLPERLAASRSVFRIHSARRHASSSAERPRGLGPDGDWSVWCADDVKRCFPGARNKIRGGGKIPAKVSYGFGGIPGRISFHDRYGAEVFSARLDFQGREFSYWNWLNARSCGDWFGSLAILGWSMSASGLYLMHRGDGDVVISPDIHLGPPAPVMQPRSAIAICSGGESLPEAAQIPGVRVHRSSGASYVNGGDLIAGHLPTYAQDAGAAIASAGGEASMSEAAALFVYPSCVPPEVRDAIFSEATRRAPDGFVESVSRALSGRGIKSVYSNGRLFFSSPSGYRIGPSSGAPPLGGDAESAATDFLLDVTARIKVGGKHLYFCAVRSAGASADFAIPGDSFYVGRRLMASAREAAAGAGMPEPNILKRGVDLPAVASGCGAMPKFFSAIPAYGFDGRGSFWGPSGPRPSGPGSRAGRSMPEWAEDAVGWSGVLAAERMAGWPEGDLKASAALLDFFCKCLWGKRRLTLVPGDIEPVSQMLGIPARGQSWPHENLSIAPIFEGFPYISEPGVIPPEGCRAAISSSECPGVKSESAPMLGASPFAGVGPTLVSAAAEARGNFEAACDILAGWSGDPELPGKMAAALSMSRPSAGGDGLFGAIVAAARAAGPNYFRADSSGGYLVAIDVIEDRPDLFGGSPPSEVQAGLAMAPRSSGSKRVRWADGRRRKWWSVPPGELPADSGTNVIAI